MKVYIQKDVVIPANNKTGWIRGSEICPEIEFFIPIIPVDTLAQFNEGFRANSEWVCGMSSKLFPARFEKVLVLDVRREKREGFRIITPFLNYPSLTLSFDNLYIGYDASPLALLPFHEGGVFCFALTTPSSLFYFHGRRLIWDRNLSLYHQALIEPPKVNRILTKAVCFIRRINTRAWKDNCFVKSPLYKQAYYVNLKPFTKKVKYIFEENFREFWRMLSSYSASFTFRHKNYEVLCDFIRLDPCIDDIKELPQLLNWVAYFASIIHPGIVIYGSANLKFFLFFSMADGVLSEGAGLFPPMKDVIKLNFEEEFLLVEFKDSFFFPAFVGNTIVWMGGI